jgi:hypothetical protein
MYTNLKMMKETKIRINEERDKYKEKFERDMKERDNGKF